MNNTEKGIVTLCNSFFISLSLMGAIPQKRPAMVRVIPYAINQQNHTISLLLERDARGNYSPIQTYIQTAKTDSTIAQELLQSISKSFLFEKRYEHAGRQTGDHYFFVQVPYVNVYILGNESKKDLVWVPGHLAAKSQSFTTQRLGRQETVTLSQSFYSFLNKNWVTVQNEILEIQPQSPAQPKAQDPTTMPEQAQQPIMPLSPATRITWQEYYSMLNGMTEAESARLKPAYADLKESDPDFFEQTINAHLVGITCECFTEEQLAQHGGILYGGQRYTDCSQAVFNTLDIQLPASEMIKIFNQYKVIMNRRPRNNKLVIGCGNLQPYTPGLNVLHVDYGYGDKFKYRAAHSHEGFDSIDPAYYRNPSIVGYFGSADITKLFGDHKYKLILIEGVTIRTLPFAAQLIYNLLDEDGIVRGVNDVRLTKKELGKRIQKDDPMLFL